MDRNNSSSKLSSKQFSNNVAKHESSGPLDDNNSCSFAKTRLVKYIQIWQTNVANNKSCVISSAISRIHGT
uniref:Uncharacterized protein n=1 Tax=Romanomermis culicivorax TaxID=13658 RepID=A0A915KPL0_ROMCU